MTLLKINWEWGDRLDVMTLLIDSFTSGYEAEDTHRQAENKSQMKCQVVRNITTASST